MGGWFSSAVCFNDTAHLECCNWIQTHHAGLQHPKDFLFIRTGFMLFKWCSLRKQEYPCRSPLIVKMSIAIKSIYLGLFTRWRICNNSSPSNMCLFQGFSRFWADAFAWLTTLCWVLFYLRYMSGYIFNLQRLWSVWCICINNLISEKMFWIRCHCCTTIH